ncbi:MAG: hypothetical protein GQ542_05660 [Desulforhopalus sp.]|nr:hypothetical protein [Desulforhopalus sp.]
MKLIQARIRGLGRLEESQWFDLSPHLNLFQFPDLNGDVFGRNFLRILQSINPTYEIQTAKPFADFPNFTEQGGYTRRVNPAKRTIALAVFSATPSLVKELAAVDEWLYETDRIEVGRRLDYSRWINFVELASSTRWSEISDNMQTLLEQARHLEPDLTTPLADILRPLKPADRIKNELQEKLAHWLENLPSELQNSSRQLIESTISAVMRADHFHTARDIVCTRLPLFVVLGNSTPPSSILDQKTASSTDLNADFLHSLLHLIASNAKSQAKESKNGGRTFFEELNEQLVTLQFSGMKLRIDRSPAGILLTIDGKPVQLSKDEPLSLLRQMQTKACLAVALSRTAYKTEPILLFAGPERALPDTLHGELADFVINIAKTCQCLYSFSDVDIFSNDVADRRYNAADLCMAGE